MPDSPKQDSGLKILVSPVRFRLWAQENQAENKPIGGSAAESAGAAESGKFEGGGTPEVQSGTGACRIPLPGGLFALVDAEDFDRLSAHKWHLKRRPSKPSELYVQRTVRLGSGRAAPKTAVTMHREVMNAQPGEVIDHRNGSGLDNRKENLRRTSNRGNSMNVVRSKNQKLGGFKGVSWNPTASKWQAQICAGEVRPNGKRKQIYLGVFDDAADAARAYDAAATKYFGEYASLNFPVVAAEAVAS